MAKIVLGIASAHGPMLLTPSELWHLRVPEDMKMVQYYKDRTWTFEELRAVRKSPEIDAQLAPEVMKEKELACRSLITTLADVFAEARIDVAVIIGNDQMEMFDGSFIPAFGVFCGDHFLSSPLSEERLAQMPAIVRPAMNAYIPAEGAAYPVDVPFATHIIESLMAENFDITVLRKQQKPECPHAFAYAYRQLMRDAPIPTVPVFLNTFYAPNQPSTDRCCDLGEGLARAIESWSEDVRVAVIGTGGLSHFVIDEQFDLEMIDALRDGTIREVAGRYPEIYYQEGTSEWKNWAPVATVMDRIGIKPTILDYIPCYRSDAGTGNAMGFVYWRAAE